MIPSARPPRAMSFGDVYDALDAMMENAGGWSVDAQASKYTGSPFLTWKFYHAERQELVDAPTGEELVERVRRFLETPATTVEERIAAVGAPRVPATEMATTDGGPHEPEGLLF